MAAAEEATVSGKTRRVRFFQHLISFANKPAFFLRAATPQQKNDSVRLFINGSDDSVGEPFPTFALVRAGLALLHGQGRVQQQYSLSRPTRQIAMGRHFYRAVLVIDLSVNVF